jgi:hypothetical protein
LGANVGRVEAGHPIHGPLSVEFSFDKTPLWRFLYREENQ